MTRNHLLGGGACARRPALPRISPKGRTRPASGAGSRSRIHAPSFLAVLVALAFAGRPAWSQSSPGAPDAPLRLESVQTSTPIRLDGRLDEEAWAAAPVAKGFRQVEPNQNQPATLDTEVRVLFDRENVYVGAFSRDPMGTEGARVPDLRRDFAFGTHDTFGVTFDPVGDGRHSVSFQTNPYGAQRDQQILDGAAIDLDWDALWRVRTERTDSGWIAEMAIPWTTLRYPRVAGAEGTAGWRINFLRIAPRLNETSGWSPWPRAYTPYRTEYGGVLVGLEPPPPTANLRLQPYAVLRGDRQVTPANGAVPRRQESGVESGIGGDAKWAINPRTVVDLTVNTDFAEADVDRQVVNLSRFNVLFPERRQFFLENASLFSAGGSDIQPFFTRRIGLDRAGLPIPIVGGVRLTQRTAQQSLGAVLVRQGAGSGLEASSFAVGRYTRNVGRQSRVGALVVSRWDEGADTVGNQRNVVGSVDALFRFGPTAQFQALASGSLTEGAPNGDGVAARVLASWRSNRGYVGHLQEYIGEGYQASTGFVVRRDLIVTSPAFHLDLRPQWRPQWVRNFIVGPTMYVYHRASDRRFEEAMVTARIDTELQNSGFVRLRLRPEWQNLEAPFQPLREVRVAPGSYRFTRTSLALGTDQSARYSGQAELATGGFYDGRLHTAALSAAASPQPYVSLTLGYTANVLRGVGETQADETTHLFVPGLRLAPSPRLQLAGSYQYNTAAAQGAANLRLNWEFRPLSNLYVVYNDRVGIDLETGRPSRSLPSGRQLIIKLAWLAQL